MSAFLDTAVDPATLERASAGDEAALAAIYRAFEIPVRTLARRIVVPRTAADDVTHDVFVDVITRLHQFEGRGSFAGWVRSIAVSRCLMHLRSPWQRSRRWLVRTIDGHEDQALSHDDASGLPEALVAPAHDDSIDLQRALARIGDTARAVVWLHDVEGYTHAEIGRLFGATASFSKSQLARAHERLRAELHCATVDSLPCMPASTIS